MPRHLGAAESGRVFRALPAAMVCLLALLLVTLITPPVAAAQADTTPPPRPAIGSIIPTQNTGGSATFTFTDTIGGDVDHYECKVERRAPRPPTVLLETTDIDPCTSPVRLDDLKAGNYAITVVAVDAAGNESFPPVGRTFSALDKHGPGSEFRFNAPADGSVLTGPMTGWTGKMDTRTTGFPSFDDLYKQEYVVDLYRKARDGSYTYDYWFREQFYLCAGCEDVEWDDSTLIIPFYPLDITAYTVSKSGSLPTADGQYHLVAGQQSSGMSDIRRFTIDTVAPDTAIDSTPGPGSNASPVFEFSGTDPDPPGGFGSGIDKFECRVNGGAWQTCTSGDPIPQTAPEGTSTLDVRAVDKGGLKDATPASTTFLVDQTPPEITITGISNKDRYLLHDGPNPTHSCTDPVAGTPPATPGASGFAPGGVLTTSSPPGCVATPINDEDLGPRAFTVTATDLAGNTSTKTVAYSIDPPRYGDFVLHDHPTAYWRMNDPMGSSEMEDSSGHGHHGEYKNDVANGRDGAPSCTRRPHPPRVCELASDPENKAAFFPERDGYGFVNGISSSPTGYTMEAWVKPRSSGAMMVMSHGRAGQLFIDGAGKLAFEQSQDTVGGVGPTLSPGQWWHVAASWDGSNTRLYVNGSQVAHSTTANKTPSGSSTFYVGYGERAPWFHGEIDEAAFYDYALDAHRIRDRHKIGTAKDLPSLERGNSPLNTEGPFTDPVAPKNNGLYAPTKVPNADFSCSDPDDLPGDSDIASCTATVDGHPVVPGGTLPDTPGPHVFEVTAVDKGGNTYVHPHVYTVKDFSSLYGHDQPIAYYRLGDGSDQPMVDWSGNGHDGEYKNDQDSGPIGIAGDGDKARDFFGAGGYGFANGIPAPTEQMTLEAWVKPDDRNRRQSIAGHGDGGELYLEGGVFKFRHGPQNRVVSAGVGPNASGFTQVVGTWDGVDLRIYVDGILKGTLESNRGPTSVSTFYVGYGEVAPWFDGAIDEVAYYAKALPPARVYQHFLADPPPGEGTGSGSGSQPTDPGKPGGGEGTPTDPGDGTQPGPGAPDTDPGDDAGDDDPDLEDEVTDDDGADETGGGKRDLMAAEFTSRPKLKAGQILSTVECTGVPDCEGTAIASAKVGKKSKKAGTKKLQIASGKTKTLRFTLSRKLKRKAAAGKIKSVSVLLEAVGGREMGRGRGR